MSINERELRDALGQFGTGVCLVSATNAAGEAFALTVNSFASVSLDPPLVLWSLQKDSDVYALYAAAETYSIAVLSAAQEALSVGYALKDNHGLKPGHFTRGQNGAPLISNALVNFECSLERAIDGGDHTILLGRVSRVVPGPQAEPLLFFGGDYRQLQ